MPSLSWNRVFAKELNEWVDSGKKGYYGDNWSRPKKELFFWLKLTVDSLIRGLKVPPRYSGIATRYIAPYITPATVAMEIGSGGGRWTQFLLKAKRIIVVDLNPEFFPYLKKRFSRYRSKFQFYQTSGYELGGIERESIDFACSFGCFVHIEPEGIFEYLQNIKRVLKPKGYAVIQYADKNKDNTWQLKCFSQMDAAKMEEYVIKTGLKLVIHETSLPALVTSNIVVIQKD